MDPVKKAATGAQVQATAAAETGQAGAPAAAPAAIPVCRRCRAELSPGSPAAGAAAPEPRRQAPLTQPCECVVTGHERGRR